MDRFDFRKISKVYDLLKTFQAKTSQPFPFSYDHHIQGNNNDNNNSVILIYVIFLF